MGDVNILMLVVTAVMAYAFGNMHFSFLIGKLFKSIDIREHGSGNSGTTNAMRVLGAGAGALAFIGDVLKAVAAVLLGALLEKQLGSVVAGLFVVIGHNWPVVLGFKGGKGIACSFGVALALAPIPALVGFGIFLIVTLVTGYVSLGSITAITSITPLLMAFGSSYGVTVPMIILFIVLWIMALIQHRPNIQRLIAGQERKFSFKKKTGEPGSKDGR